MEKIVLIADSNRLDDSLIDFGCYLATLTQSKLMAILLDNIGIELRIAKAYSRQVASENQEEEAPVVMDHDQSTLYFMEACRKKSVQAEVYVENGSPSEAVLFESRFADLVIVSPALSFLGDADDMPSSFVKRVLAKSECPVVLAPDSFNKVEEIVFCYDGSASSLFAIKQFTYLFPQYHSVKVKVLELGSRKELEEDEGQTKTISWLKAHYSHVDFQIFEGESKKDDLFTWFLNKKDLFIVMGAFGRPLLSNLFRRSASELVIKTIDLPLFIAHH